MLNICFVQQGRAGALLPFHSRVSSLSFIDGAFAYQCPFWKEFVGSRSSWKKWLKFVTSGAGEGLKHLNFHVSAKNLATIRNKLANVNMFH